MTVRPLDLLRVIEELQRRVKALEVNNRLSNASIGAGGRLQVVRADTGVTVAEIGDIGYPDPEGSEQSGVLLNRQNGTAAITLYDPDPTMDGFAQAVSLWDNNGNAVVADDAASGQGLARPWLPFLLNDVRTTIWPTTTSATFTDLLYGVSYKQHANVQVQIQAQTGTATVGEYQLVQGVTVIGDVVQVAAATNQDIIWTVPVAGYFGETIDLHVQARRVSGANAVTCQLYGAWSLPAPAGA